MENQISSKSTILNYGLYAGGASILLALVLYAMGKAADPGIAISLIGSIIPLALLVLGIRKFKSLNNGYLSWGQASKNWNRNSNGMGSIGIRIPIYS